MKDKFNVKYRQLTLYQVYSFSSLLFFQSSLYLLNTFSVYSFPHNVNPFPILHFHQLTLTIYTYLRLHFSHSTLS